MILEKEALKEIGLTDSEIEVYITLLRIGSSPVSSIAENSKLYRPYVYDTLKRLSEKGFVGFVLKDGKKHFHAANPERLLLFLKEKEDALRMAIPKLMEITKLSKEEAKIEMYGGNEVVKIVQKDILKTLLEKGGENLAIGVNEKRFMKINPLVMKWFFRQLKKNKIRERIIVREGDTFLPAYKSTTEYRFVPKEFFNPTSTLIYGNSVAIIIFTEPLRGLIIESEELSDAYRKQFNLIWKNAKKRI